MVHHAIRGARHDFRLPLCRCGLRRPELPKYIRTRSKDVSQGLEHRGKRYLGEVAPDWQTASDLFLARVRAKGSGEDRAQ